MNLVHAGEVKLGVQVSMLCGQSGIQSIGGFPARGLGVAANKSKRRSDGNRGAAANRFVGARPRRFAHSRLVREGTHLVTSPGVTVQWWAGVGV